MFSFHFFFSHKNKRTAWLETPVKGICWYSIFLLNAQNGWHRKTGYRLVQYATQNLIRSNLWFLSKLVRIYNQLRTFVLYILTSRLCCAETTHVPSGHACYNTYRVWSESAKALWRYSLMSIFVNILSNLLTRFMRTVWFIRNILRIFCQHCQKMIWSNFGENQKNRLGQVRKNIFFAKFKIAKNLDL